MRYQFNKEVKAMAVKKNVDTTYMYMDRPAATPAPIITDEKNQSIYTGINNKLITVKAGDIKQLLREYASTNNDTFTSLKEVWKASNAKDLFFTEKAKSDFYAKLGLSDTFLRKCSNELRIRVVEEFIEKAAENILLRTKKDETGRTIARAILSKEYSKLDNSPIVEALYGNNDQELHLRTFVNDGNYLKMEIVDKDHAFELDEPNGKRSLYYPIIGIENSEVGSSTLNFRSGVYRGVCANGLTVKVAEFLQNVRHIYQDVAYLMRQLNEMDVNMLSEKNDKIINLYRNSIGIYVPDVESELLETVNYNEETGKADYPDKLVENAVLLSRSTYKSEKPTYWHVINSITEALHRTYNTPKQANNRFDYESEFQGVFAKRLAKLTK